MFLFYASYLIIEALNLVGQVQAILAPESVTVRVSAVEQITTRTVCQQGPRAKLVRVAVLYSLWSGNTTVATDGEYAV